MNYTRATTAAVAATLLLGQAQSAMAEPTFSDAVIIGRVKLQGMPSSTNEAYLAVTIPASDGMLANVKLWDLGTVRCGGVYDSFYNGGPGHFRVQNTGDYPAYVYVSTGEDGEVRGFESLDVNNTSDLGHRLFDNYHGLEVYPWLQICDDEWYSSSTFKLAVSTDVTAIVPTWKPLSYLFCYDSWNWSNHTYTNARYVDGRTLTLRNGMLRSGANELPHVEDYRASAYLAYLPVGETQLFDLKFWAPLERRDSNDSTDWLFFITIEASAVKFWEHDQ